MVAGFGCGRITLHLFLVINELFLSVQPIPQIPYCQRERKKQKRGPLVEFRSPEHTQDQSEVPMTQGIDSELLGLFLT